LSGKTRVVVVGGMNIDIQGKCLRPFRPGDSNPGDYSSRPGGVGRNIAENLARLGIEVELISAIGRDGDSRELADSCAAAGIGIEGLLRLEGLPCPRYLCICDSDGSLAGAVAAMEAMDRLLPEALEERSGLLDSAALVIVDANVPESSIRWLAARYPRGGGGPALAFDPVSVAKAPRGSASLASFAFAKPNLPEASVLAGLGKPAPSEAPAKDAAVAGLSAALRAKGLGEAFVSLGPRGIRAEGPGAPAPRGPAPSPEVWTAALPSEPPAGLEPVNSSGAGDAACAAIAWGFLRGAGLGERCALALAASIIAAASESPVNPRLSIDRLLETAKGIRRERIS
jgi:pseudouridine kinase